MTRFSIKNNTKMINKRVACKNREERCIFPLSNLLKRLLMKSMSTSYFILFVELITIFALSRQIVGRYRSLQKSEYIVSFYIFSCFNNRNESDKCRIRYLKTGIDSRIIQYVFLSGNNNKISEEGYIKE